MVNDFFRLLESRFNEESFDFFSGSAGGGYKNPTMTAESMVILHRFRKSVLSDHDGYFHESSRSLESSLKKNKIGKKKPRLKTHVRKALCHRFKDEIAEIENRYGVRLVLEGCDEEDELTMECFEGDLLEVLEGVSERDVSEALIELISSLDNGC